MNLTYYEAFELLNNKILSYDDSEPFLIIIDGRSASGKTTFANQLSLSTGFPVIHTDDFYRPKNPLGKIEMTEFNGNFNVERFYDEVICGINGKSTFEYGVFDCKLGEITCMHTVPLSKVYIIEGAYSHHPILSGLKCIKIFFSASMSSRLERITARNGIEQAKRFVSLWMPAEERYFEHYDIISRCDFFVDTTDED